MGTEREFRDFLRDKADIPSGNILGTAVIELDYGDIEWMEGAYLERPANVYSINSDLITNDIINNGTIIGYCYCLDESWVPLPIAFEDETGAERSYITFIYSVHTISIFAYGTSGLLDPSMIAKFRFLLINTKV